MKKVLLTLIFAAIVVVGYPQASAKIAKNDKVSITYLGPAGKPILGAKTLTVKWSGTLPKGTALFLSINDAADPLTVQKTQWVSTTALKTSDHNHSFEFPLKKELLPKGLKKGSKVTIRMEILPPGTKKWSDTKAAISEPFSFT